MTRCLTCPETDPAKFSRSQKLRNKAVRCRRCMNAYNLERGRRIRAILATFKAGKGCKTCGERDPRCLDFHHREKDGKGKGISGLVMTAGLERIMREIEKCDVVCANCHRKLHPGDRNG